MYTIITNTNDWVYKDSERNKYYKEYCEENGIEYNEDNSFDWALEEAQFNEECDWDNLKCMSALNSPAKLSGKLSTYHLWDGYHKIYDKDIDNLLDFLQRVIFDGNDKTYTIYLYKGKIMLEWSDHDSPCGGTKLVFVRKGKKNYYTRKEIWG